MSLIGVIAGASRRRAVADPLLDGLVEAWWLDDTHGGVGAKGAFSLTENGTLTQNSAGGPGGLGYTAGTDDPNANYYSLAHDGAFGLSEYSVSYWARIPDPVTSSNLFYRSWIKGSSALDSNAVWFRIQLQPNATDPTALRFAGNWDSAAAFGTNLDGDPRGVWNHIVHQLTPTRRRTWVNGSLFQDATKGTALSNTDNLRVMSNNDGANNHDTALFYWYDRELVSAEISRLYNGGPSGAPLTPTDIGL